jgi:hypothetical protein
MHVAGPHEGTVPGFTTNRVVVTDDNYWQAASHSQRTGCD